MAIQVLIKVQLFIGLMMQFEQIRLVAALESKKTHILSQMPSSLPILPIWSTAGRGLMLKAWKCLMEFISSISIKVFISSKLSLLIFPHMFGQASAFMT